MGKVQQRAGGGRVTVEGLTAEDIRFGRTVEVNQGSKTVSRAVGAYRPGTFRGYVYPKDTARVTGYNPQGFFRYEIGQVSDYYLRSSLKITFLKACTIFLTVTGSPWVYTQSTVKHKDDGEYKVAKDDWIEMYSTEAVGNCSYIFTAF